MALRDDELARREEGRTLLRPAPLRVRWNLADLTAADGHELQITFAAGVRALPDPAERRMLEEVLLGARPAVAETDVRDHFRAALESAVGRIAGSRSAEQWIDGDGSGEMIAALRAGAAPIAFACGVELFAPFDLEIRSPAWRAERLRAMQQAQNERRTVEQMESMRRAAELLRQFQSLREAMPELSPGGALERLNPADRGSALQTLLIASARDSVDRLWAVSGPMLVRIEMPGDSPVTTPHELPRDLGPLRSVTFAEVEGERRLLIGARDGFLSVNPEDPRDARLFADGRPPWRLGFNRVVSWNARHVLAASHGEAGIVCRPINGSQAPAVDFGVDRLRAPGGDETAGPRNLTVLNDSRLLFSAGARLLATDLESIETIESPSPSPVVAILPNGTRFVIVHEDGTLRTLDSDLKEAGPVVRRGSRVRAAAMLPWLGANRLLLAQERGPVECVGLDDPLVTQYQSAYPGLRAIGGSTGLVAGVSDERSRIILWRSWDGSRPVAEIHLTGLTRHRVADIAFG